MKTNRILVMGILLVSGIASAQITVPDNVRKAFDNKYPAAKNVEWGKESASEFEAEFTMNGVAMTASFDPGGTWIESETVLKTDQLPLPVISSLKKKYDEFEILKAEKLEKPNTAALFEIRLDVEEQNVEATLDGNGVFITQEKMETTEENKEISETEENEEISETEENEGAEEIKVPKAVMESFNKAFPGAVIHELAGETEKGKQCYEISCVLKGKRMDVLFDESGVLISKETRISKKELPAAVIDKLNKDYKRFSINTIETVEEGGSVLYEIKVSSKDEAFELVFSKEGDLKKKEQLKAKEDNEEEEQEEKE